MSNAFRDTKNREWQVTIDVAALKRLRLLARLNLDDLIPKDIGPDKDVALKHMTAYAEFLADEIRFSEALWALVQPQASQLGITVEEFDSGLAGESMTDAILAFHGAFTDFSQNPRKGMLRGFKVSFNRMAAKLKKMDEVTDEKLDRLIEEQERLSSAAGNTAGSSGSIPASAP